MLKIRNAILKSGVIALKEFGYENVTKKNIMTDKIYKSFFISYLKDNLGVSKEYNEVIKRLLIEIEL